MRLYISVATMMMAAPLMASWPKVLETAGLEGSRVTVLEGASAAAQAAGFRAGGERVEVRSVVDTFAPKLPIVWAETVRVARFEVPVEATVFTRERWTGAPLAAGFRSGDKVVFWTAVGLGERGYERFPYVPQALVELGLKARVESRGLWAFLDTSYRTRADVEYLAARWRRGGIASMHIAAWHYWEADGQRDEWLKKLIEACHRNAITVYAWVELPHVSEAFWREHPEWREQTAAGQDAHLDWRRLMNLANAGCAREVEAGLRALMERFDWDGVNLGELYFESLEGYMNPARFTPFNADVRARFKARYGADPRDFYNPLAAAYHLRDARPMRRFLEFRAELAGELQKEWLEKIESIREKKPWLDVALTHVDDRFDATMRDSLGADAARLLPVASKHGATFLVEDPATIWHLGPERYTELAKRYAAIAPAGAALAVDLNIVERYQDVYPTKQQTGSELFQLLSAAARAFPRVAVYFENSIQAADWALVAAAASPARWRESGGGGLAVESPQAVAVEWEGCAEVNGERWGAYSSGRLLLPAGVSKVERCAGAAEPLLADFNGELRRVEMVGGRLKVDYESRGRAIAVLPGKPGRAVMLAPGKRTVWID